MLAIGLSAWDGWLDSWMSAVAMEEILIPRYTGKNSNHRPSPSSMIVTIIDLLLKTPEGYPRLCRGGGGSKLKYRGGVGGCGSPQSPFGPKRKGLDREKKITTVPKKIDVGQIAFRAFSPTSRTTTTSIAGTQPGYPHRSIVSSKNTVDIADTRPHHGRIFAAGPSSQLPSCPACRQPNMKARQAWQ